MPILCSGRGEFALGSVRVTFLAEMQLAVRAVAQKHREEASGKRVQDWQPRARQGNWVHGWQGNARWERRCTTDKHRRARGAASK